MLKHLLKTLHLLFLSGIFVLSRTRMVNCLSIGCKFHVSHVSLCLNCTEYLVNILGLVFLNEDLRKFSENFQFCLVILSIKYSVIKNLWDLTCFMKINADYYFNKIAWWQMLIHLMFSSIMMLLWQENLIFFTFLMQIFNQKKKTTSEKKKERVKFSLSLNLPHERDENLS